MTPGERALKMARIRSFVLGESTLEPVYCPNCNVAALVPIDERKLIDHWSAVEVCKCGWCGEPVIAPMRVKHTGQCLASGVVVSRVSRLVSLVDGRAYDWVEP